MAYGCGCYCSAVSKPFLQLSDSRQQGSGTGEGGTGRAKDNGAKSNGHSIANFVKDAGYDTVEKFTDWLMQSPDGKPYFRKDQLHIIVTGGSNNNYYSIGGMRYMTSVQIDKWR